jgi:hypothetical protein
MLAATRSNFVLCLACLSLYLAMYEVASAQQRQLTCPAPPQQVARDVSVDTKGKVAGLGKLKVGELENKTEVVVKPLLDSTPNSDRLLMAQMMTSIFCQVISQSSLSDKEKLDRFDAFNEKILGLLSTAPPTQSPAPATQAPTTPASSKPKVEPRKTSAVTPWGKLVPFQAGSTIKQASDRLGNRPVTWNQDGAKRYQATFPVNVGEVELTGFIQFDHEDKAESHWLEKSSSSNVNYENFKKRPRLNSVETEGSEAAVNELCRQTTDRLAEALAEKLGNAVLPLSRETTENRKEAWGVMGVRRLPDCGRLFSCSADASISTRRALYEDGKGQIEFLIKRIELTRLIEGSDIKSTRVYKGCFLTIAPTKE